MPDSLNLDAARQYLNSLAQNGNLTLEQALSTTIAGTRIGDIPGINAALTEMAADGVLTVDDVLNYVNSNYTITDGSLVPKGSGQVGDARGIDLDGLSAMAELMLLMIQQAAEQRKTGQELRLAQSEAIQQKLFDSAEDLRTGAIVAMTMGVVGGVASIAGGVAGVKAGTSEAANSANAIGGGFSQIFKSTGDGVQGILSAESKEEEAEAEKIRARREEQGDTIANIKDFMQTTLQLIQTMLEKENETLAKVLV
ncbi:MAG: hypothetical protein LBQ63_06260 [Deltaproteobacteria bacterium]|jgi:hypothetical protein|nr:hypothetical protein [Deltaproteobacteria bacterium]